MLFLLLHLQVLNPAIGSANMYLERVQHFGYLTVCLVSMKHTFSLDQTFAREGGDVKENVFCITVVLDRSFPGYF